MKYQHPQLQKKNRKKPPGERPAVTEERNVMPITELLSRNATYFKNETALVEINPEAKGIPRVTWRE